MKHIGWVIATGEHDHLVQANRDFARDARRQGAQRARASSGAASSATIGTTGREHFRRFVPVTRVGLAVFFRQRPDTARVPMKTALGIVLASVIVVTNAQTDDIGVPIEPLRYVKNGAESDSPAYPWGFRIDDAMTGLATDGQGVWISAWAHVVVVDARVHRL